MLNIYEFEVDKTVYGRAYYYAHNEDEAHEMLLKHGDNGNNTVWDGDCDFRTWYTCPADCKKVDTVPEGIIPLGKEEYRIQYQHKIAELQNEIAKLNALMTELG